MDVTRIKHTSGHVVYRVTAADRTIVLLPKELMTLLTWLQEHEQEIVNDAIANIVRDAENE